jgi:hypothetical protein
MTGSDLHSTRSFLWREYVVIVLVGLAGYAMKKPFGLLLHHIMGIVDAASHSLLGWASDQGVQIFVVAILASLVHRYTTLPAAPSLERLLYGMHKDRKLRIWLWGLAGFVACIIVAGGIRFVGAKFGVVAPLASKLDLSGLTAAQAHRLLFLYPQTAIGAGLSEEVLYRFGLLTLFAWALSGILPAKHASYAVAAAVILQAILFGYAHVSEGIMQLPVGGTLMQVAIAPETWVGIVFGYWYVRFGLEAAVIAHATADLLNLSFFVMTALKHAHG